MEIDLFIMDDGFFAPIFFFFQQDAVYIDLGGSKAGQRAAAAAAALSGKNALGVVDDEPENELISSLHSTSFDDKRVPLRWRRRRRRRWERRK